MPALLHIEEYKTCTAPIPLPREGVQHLHVHLAVGDHPRVRAHCLQYQTRGAELAVAEVGVDEKGHVHRS